MPLLHGPRAPGAPTRRRCIVELAARPDEAPGAAPRAATPTEPTRSWAAPWWSRPSWSTRARPARRVEPGLREGLALDAFDRERATGGMGPDRSRWPRSPLASATWDAETAERRAGIAAQAVRNPRSAAPTPVPEMLDMRGHAPRRRPRDRLPRPLRARGGHRGGGGPGRVRPSSTSWCSRPSSAGAATTGRDRTPRAAAADDADRPLPSGPRPRSSLASELDRRIPPRRTCTHPCNWRRDGFEVVAPVPPGLASARRGAAVRAAGVRAQPPLVVASEVAARPAVTA